LWTSQVTFSFLLPANSARDAVRLLNQRLSGVGRGVLLTGSHGQVETLAQELQKFACGTKPQLRAGVNFFDPALKEAIGWTSVVAKSKYERESHTGNNLSKSDVRIHAGSTLLELEGTRGEGPKGFAS